MGCNFAKSLQSPVRSPVSAYTAYACTDERPAMNTWRPDPRIKVKALGLHWRHGRLLAAEVLNDKGQVKGVRPLGGGMEFGERWQDTLTREFQEELGIHVQILGEPRILENIYTHEGAPGHEVIFISEVAFSPDAFAGQDSIRFFENNGAACVARWYDLAQLDIEGSPELYPSGLKQLLLKDGA